jgi:enamine deaminase RidA (YjgF/YER057c/UK114 family)
MSALSIQETTMNPSTTERRLRELGLELPSPPGAVAAYAPVVRTGNLVITSGQLPWVGDKLVYTGKLGTELTVEQGYEAARRCALNALAQLRSVLADLDQVRQVLRVEGYVHCGPGFRQQPQVLNGASDLINSVFGERGKHTRTALGIHEMPLDAPVQLVLWAEIE